MNRMVFTTTTTTTAAAAAAAAKMIIIKRIRLDLAVKDYKRKEHAF